MTEKARAIKRYERKIRGLLPCTFKMKSKIAHQIRDNIDDYLAENPDAEFEQIVAQFGAPETIAAAYIESTGTADILKSLQMRKRILAIAAAIAAAVLLSWAGIVTWTAVRADQNTVQSLHFEDGGSMEIIAINSEPNQAQNSISGTKTIQYRDTNGNVVWEATLNAVFSCLGGRAECMESNCSVTIYDDAWHVAYKTSGEFDDTAITHLKMSYSVLGRTAYIRAFTVTLTCDENGNMN